MGLSISRSIIEAHRGRLWGTRNPDRGLTLHVTLPSTRSERPEPRDRASTRDPDDTSPVARPMPSAAGG